MSLLRVENVDVTYEPSTGQTIQAVSDVSFTLDRGEFVGLVGESGSGKSTLGFALTQLTPPAARITGGQIFFNDEDVVALSSEELRRRRQGGFAMVLQSGMNALNPVRTIRNHFADIFHAHGHVAAGEREERVRELLTQVELDPDVAQRYPYELSGGMRQRVSIALALSLEPHLVVFDEPTTALDVLVQQSVMSTIRRLQAEQGFTALLISHDLGLVLESTSRVLVMHEGHIVEEAASKDLLTRPQDTYTRMLLSHYADPRAEVVELPGLSTRGKTAGLPSGHDGDTPRANVPQPKSVARGDADEFSVFVDDVCKTYPPPRRGASQVDALDHVSMQLLPGQSLALVGASGSGKSTLASLITGIEKPTSGTVRVGGEHVGSLRRRQLRSLRRKVQLVFQDPYAALNPLHTVEYALTRPIVNHTNLRGHAVRQRVLELLDRVGLTPVEQFAAKLPHQLSGGQRQRVVIARALASNPRVLVADEPVSMLDVSLRAGVLALLEDLRTDTGISLLYITHDLLSARVITDEVIVLNQGRVVESGPTDQVLRFPKDDYTTRLLDAVPQPARAKDRAS